MWEAGDVVGLLWHEVVGAGFGGGFGDGFGGGREGLVEGLPALPEQIKGSASEDWSGDRRRDCLGWGME